MIIDGVEFREFNVGLLIILVEFLILNLLAKMHIHLTFLHLGLGHLGMSVSCKMLKPT